MDAEEQQQRRAAFRKTTAKWCESMVYSACVNKTSPTALMEFALFPKLPAELRIKIWCDAINAPRYVDLRAMLGILCPNTRYPSITPPSPLLACKESYKEVIRAYASCQDCVEKETTGCAPYIQWIRFDHDIIHLIPEFNQPDVIFTMAGIFAKPGQTIPIRQHSGLNSQRNLSTDRWNGRPVGFENIQTLAVSRDILQHIPDDAEPFIRHFFPNLLLLLVLIDEDIDIEEAWNIRDSDYSIYENPSNKSLRTAGGVYNNPRLDFAAKCRGPFKEVRLNIDYRLEIEFEMRKRFEIEEETYRCYTAPRIRVLGAFVPEGVTVAECSRLPCRLVGIQGTGNHYNPFGSLRSI